MATIFTKLRTWLRSLCRHQGHPLRRAEPLMVEELERREVLSASSFFLEFGRSQSPVAPGYTQVPLVAYTSARGFGWNDLTSMYAGDWGGSDPLTREFHYGLG